MVEIDSIASKLVDLSRFEVEGLPVSVTREERQESKAGYGYVSPGRYRSL